MRRSDVQNAVVFLFGAEDLKPVPKVEIDKLVAIIGSATVASAPPPGRSHHFIAPEHLVVVADGRQIARAVAAEGAFVLCPSVQQQFQLLFYLPGRAYYRRFAHSCFSFPSFPQSCGLSSSFSIAPVISRPFLMMRI